MQYSSVGSGESIWDMADVCVINPNIFTRLSLVNCIKKSPKSRENETQENSPNHCLICLILALKQADRDASMRHPENS